MSSSMRRGRGWCRGVGSGPGGVSDASGASGASEANQADKADKADKVERWSIEEGRYVD